MTQIERALKIISLYKSEIADNMLKGGKALGVKSAFMMLNELEEVLRK